MPIKFYEKRLQVCVRVCAHMRSCVYISFLIPMNACQRNNVYGEIAIYKA